MKTSINPSYKPLTQQHYCCVPTCIQMILSRRGIKPDSQEEIGWHLGLVVPKEDRHLFTKVRVGKKPKGGYGTQIGLKKYSLNSYLKKRGVPLRMELKKRSAVGGVDLFLEKNLREGNDIIVCFYNEKLFGKGTWGHVCLVEGLDTAQKKVMLIDPEKGVPKRRTVPIQKLLAAIKYHESFGKTAGFWVVKNRHSWIGSMLQKGMSLMD